MRLLRPSDTFNVSDASCRLIADGLAVFPMHPLRQEEWQTGVQRAHFYGKIAPGGHLKILSGTKIRENRGRWRLFHMSTGRGIISCPPGMIRADFRVR